MRGHNAISNESGTAADLSKDLDMYIKLDKPTRNQNLGRLTFEAPLFCISVHFRVSSCMAVRLGTSARVSKYYYIAALHVSSTIYADSSRLASDDGARMKRKPQTRSPCR